MRRPIFRMPEAEARALFARARVLHLSGSAADGRPIVKTLDAVVVELGGRPFVAFHGAPVGEKLALVDRPVVATAEEVVASIPSTFVDPERACPATTLYRSAVAHGVLEAITSEADKARVLAALLDKQQPEGGYVPLEPGGARWGELYRKAVAGLFVAGVALDDVTGKQKLGQNRTEAERARIGERLFERGAPGDLRALRLVREASPGDAAWAFLRGPEGSMLEPAPDEREVDQAVDLVASEHWNAGISREVLREAHLASSGWVVAKLEGRVVATARAVSDRVKRGWIYDVGVAPELRRRGLGRAVVGLLLRHPALARTLDVRLATRDAEGVYTALGFRPTSPDDRPYRSRELRLDRAAGRAAPRLTSL
jgi:nitroimidazol reductase NimA-like FMN-containing flavoprotein (pyridoxamine 5'-phosphate oxidase superfamily)/ribosomal protein S18 acetylase RimI-like enzyme